MDMKEMFKALDDLEEERGISKEVIISAIEEALNTSYGYKKEAAKDDEEDEYSDDFYCEKYIEIDREDGRIILVRNKIVVEKVEDPEKEVSLEDARKDDPDFELGEVEELREPLNDIEMGRIAAHKAKNIIIQKMKEAERSMILSEFHGKEKEVVTGTIRKIYDAREGKEPYVAISIGKVEDVMQAKEQVSGEVYEVNKPIKVYVLEVKEKSGKSKDPTVYVSRSHPGLLKQLFKNEVPEIEEGIVEIRGVAREAGSRSKIAVYSTDIDVEPVGACVGQAGQRVQKIVNELHNERIDIIKWSESSAEFISSSLSPAKIVRTYVNEADKTSLVIVPDNQLSLAIGKEGQNVRLAAKLTGWKIDIKSESQIKSSIEENLMENGDEAVYESSGEENSFSTGAEE